MKVTLRNKGRPLQLILFKTALEHVIRVCRILRLNGGCALLIGQLYYTPYSGHYTNLVGSRVSILPYEGNPAAIF